MHSMVTNWRVDIERLDDDRLDVDSEADEWWRPGAVELWLDNPVDELLLLCLCECWDVLAKDILGSYLSSGGSIDGESDGVRCQIVGVLVSCGSVVGVSVFGGDGASIGADAVVVGDGLVGLVELVGVFVVCGGSCWIVIELGTLSLAVR